MRGGLFFQSRIEIRALAAIEHPRLVLDEGWVEGMQVNSIEPAAESETSRDGRVVLSYGALEPGDVLRVWLQFQVEPTNVGTRDYRRRARRRGPAAGPRPAHDPGAAVMDLVLRTIVVFVLILIVTRAVGRRELSSMEPFDLILLVVIGDLVQQGVTQSDYSLTGAATVIFTMAVLVVATA